MGVSGRIGRDLELIRSDAFAESCRSRPADFTRRRKMPHDLLVESVVARKGRTLSLEVREFAREAHMAEPISVPGYLNARQKLEPLALLELARHHAAGVYADGDHDTYRGMLLVAIDGSTANVPTNPGTVARYGSSSGFGRQQATMGLSAAFDVVNRLLLDLTANRGGFDERAEVAGHLEVVLPMVGCERVVLVLDRGYPSFLLLATLADMGVPYVMRCQRNFMSAEFRRCEAAGGDVELDVELTRHRLQHVREADPDAWERLAGRGPLRVRCVLADVGGSAPERLITTVGADELTPAELAEVYHMRWGVETCFQFMKDRLQMENFTGTSPRLIEQDVYATAYLLNVAFDLANEAEREAAGDIAARGYKHAMAVNRTVAIGVLKDELMRIVMAPDDGSREAMMADIVAELGRCLVPVRPARAYGRDGLGQNYANRYSNTHKRVF